MRECTRIYRGTLVGKSYVWRVQGTKRYGGLTAKEWGHGLQAALENQTAFDSQTVLDDQNEFTLHSSEILLAPPS